MSIETEELKSSTSENVYSISEGSRLTLMTMVK